MGKALAFVADDYSVFVKVPRVGDLNQALAMFRSVGDQLVHQETDRLDPGCRNIALVAADMNGPVQDRSQIRAKPPEEFYARSLIGLMRIEVPVNLCHRRTSDVRLNVGTGPEAVRAIHEKLGNIPVNFITSSPAECEPCDRPGEVLEKPIDQGELASSFHRIAPT